MTKGILDRSLKDRTEPEQRRAQAMAWIETLKGGGVAWRSAFRYPASPWTSHVLCPSAVHR